MMNPAALRPKYGEAFGRAGADGRVVATDQYEQFLDALVFAATNARGQGATGAGGVSRGQVLALVGAAIDERYPVYREVTGDYTARGVELLHVTAAATITLGPWGAVTVWVDTSAPVSVTDGHGTDVLELRGTVISYRHYGIAGWVRGA